VKKHRLVGYLLWAFGLIGLCGLHRMYVGKGGTGVLWFCSFGLLFFGQAADLLSIGRMVDEANALGRGARGGAAPPVVVQLVPMTSPPVRELIKLRCSYCGELCHASATDCTRCGARV
jgi:TM2 domain-containing membrane protein YozV